MKKLMICLAAVMMLLMMGCKEDETIVLPITGVWKPVQMVRNHVAPNNTATTTETITYEDCQQSGRWTFNEDKSGKVLQKDLINTTCVEVKNSNFTYIYDHKTGELKVNYITGNDNAIISDLTEGSMNLKIEKIDQTGYTSETTSLIRVN